MHNVSRVERKATCTENLVKFGHVVFEIHEQTDRQTEALIAKAYLLRARLPEG